MLDFADVFKTAPTLQQMQIPALSKAPRIRLLRLTEPNCKEQQAAGPSGSKTPVPGKARPNAKEQELGHPPRVVCAHHVPTGPRKLSPKHAYTCFLREKQPVP